MTDLVARNTRILDRYRAGDCVRAIAADEGVSRQRVWGLAHAAGLDRHGSRPGPRGRAGGRMTRDRALTSVQRIIITRLLDGPATTREIRALLPTSGADSVRGSLRILARQGRIEPIGHRWSTAEPATWALTPMYEARVRHGLTRLGPGLRTMLVLLDRAPAPVSLAELRAALGLTIAVARRLLDHARRDPALVHATRLAPAWGRPAQGWSITEEGRALLHDRERLRAREAA